MISYNHYESLIIHIKGNQICKYYNKKMKRARESNKNPILEHY